FAVRSVPTLNDATAQEAATVEMDKIAKIVENGIDGPLPGTVTARCSDQMKELTENADLILSKGGGNFDSIEEETHLHDKILFMLMSKCVPLCNYFGTKMYDPILSPPRRNALRFKSTAEAGNVDLISPSTCSTANGSLLIPTRLPKRMIFATMGEPRSRAIWVTSTSHATLDNLLILSFRLRGSGYF